jgi:transcriptional regulator with XRE-family HTH domain
MHGRKVFQVQATPDESLVPPGQLIRTARQAVGLSQERLARDADVSTATIVRLERAGKLPNVPALVRIAGRLGISLDELTRSAHGSEPDPAVAVP